MLKQSPIHLCWMLLAITSTALAQQAEPPVTVPSLSQIAPGERNQSLKQSLDQRYAELTNRYSAWKQRAEAFNKKYSGHEFDADSQEARDGAVEQTALSALLETYDHDAEAFKADVAKLSASPNVSDAGGVANITGASSQDADAIRIINGMYTLARHLGWDEAKLKQLNRALNELEDDGNLSKTAEDVRKTWQQIEARPEDSVFANEASHGEGLGYPGAGLQTLHNDCTIFALANATGRPYGWVAAQATDLLRQASWRTSRERDDPQKTIENHGLNGGEVVMLAESLGQAEVLSRSDFAATIKRGRPIMINVEHHNGDLKDGHEVVLLKTFQHGGETWFEMMDSNDGPQRHLFLSNSELGVVLKEKGVAFKSEPGREPQLLRVNGGL